MKLYTKRGDDGRTDLIGGPRVSKDHGRVEAYGSVDELNAAIGLAVADCSIDAVRSPLITAQARLFDLGAQLATAPADNPNPPGLSAGTGSETARVTDAHVAEVERQIDAASAGPPPLNSFILPGGAVLAARLHLARTICRRAERRLVALAELEPVAASAVVYLNRLSDLLFALARLANHEAGVPDVPWKPSTNEHNTDPAQPQ